MKNKTYPLLMSLMAVSILFFGCSSSAHNAMTPIEAAHAEVTSVDVTLTSTDIDALVSDKETTTLTEENGLYITNAGTYTLTEDVTNGQIVVDADKDALVYIILQNVTLHNENGAAIYVKNAKSVTIILPDGTTNTISDSKNYVFNEGEDEPNATIFSKTDLIFAGTGTLIVKANYHHGIFSKDDLIIEDGTYVITSEGDAIKGKDSITVLNGHFTLVAKGDGLQSNNSEKENKGWILIENGSFSIAAQNDGIQAATTLTIHEGDFTIVTGDGSEEPQVTSQTMMMRPNQGFSPSASTEESVSQKGLKADSDIIIYNGVFSIDAADDAIHSDANIYIYNGNYTLQSSDDAIHGDGNVTIQDGSFEILRSYEGIEGANIVIHGGHISVKASDDGMNVLQGGTLTINGGTIHVDAGGDGLDANGHIVISGGTTLVSGSTQNMDAALDYDQTMTISGGTLIAYGSSGMAQAPSTSSTQASISYYYAQTKTAGTTVSLVDDSGETLYTFTAVKAFNSVVISTPDLATGKSYHIYTNGELTSTFSLTGSVTSIAENGASIQNRNQPGGGRRP